MDAHIAALYRHPVKGFTPERLTHADLSVGQEFPCDRMYAVENGPSGFDPSAPAWVTKMKFTVLATLPQVALAATAFDETSGLLSARAEGQPDFIGDLNTTSGQQAFADWLKGLLGEDAHPSLKVIQAPGHSFMDHPLGHVSILNLASVRDLEARTGREIDPLRFRANIYVEGWPAWAEDAWEGRDLMVGFARARVYKPIQRCIATHVDPATGARDMDLVKALYDNYGHMNCGLYVHVTDGGRICPGDACTSPQERK